MSKEKAIQEIGVRLLRGETMCAESCPFGCNCPLMESKKEGIVCVNCLKKFVRDPEEGILEASSHLQPSIDPPQTQKREETNRHLANSNPQATNKHVTKDEHAVNPVASRMLEGWTMLGTSCPLCFNPLVKSPVDNRLKTTAKEESVICFNSSYFSIWCAVCNVQAIHEKDFDATKHRVVSKDDVEPAKVAQRHQEDKKQPEKKHEKHDPLPSSDDGFGFVQSTLKKRLIAANEKLSSLSIDQTLEAEKWIGHISTIVQAMKLIKE